MTQHLQGLNFPAPKKDMIGQAQKQEADSGVMSALRAIPGGMYNSASEVAEHVSGKHE
ncbi:MAG: DUF2795 domain-containing protein [Halofilum sp. (in: g-proteobacteria)]